MTNITLFYGTDHIIKNPKISLGKDTKDFGRGFYCTLLPEMAKEWACKQNTDGFVNEYSFSMDGLKVLNLLDGKYTVLNWIAILLKYRIFTINNAIAQDAKEYLIEHFSIDTTQYDVIIGYRADDSYFSYAQSFVHNALPLRSLAKALVLGKLGEQTVLVSEKAFNHIKFVGAEPVAKEIYYPKFVSRDTKAREEYQKEIKVSKNYKEDIFVMDILREGITNNDPRVQRIIFE
ncbi:MAG: DUF3990 domain-containing protein [Clostridia bacterium]|nr:DUF3990 domain-containing protein [Clostridia bacterium]